ncbi:porin [Microvirga sp. W0021]|uniref:Porin n=1 Tax=Hohaiivirga grylli TaxID=3133970 RepID=A0ABV0BJ92_9HYPH
MPDIIRQTISASALTLVLVTSGTAYASEKPFPKAPSPSDTMQACPEYGAGFFKTPGSDTCIRIGGSVRGETGFSSKGRHNADKIDWRTEGSATIESYDRGTGGRVLIRMKGVRSSN